MLTTVGSGCRSWCGRPERVTLGSREQLWWDVPGTGRWAAADGSWCCSESRRAPVNRLALGLWASASETNPAFYGIRLVSDGLILLAIWQKNRPRS